jgi:hypothetical protein
MIERGKKSFLPAGLVALLLIAASSLAQASFTKLYSFTNTTGVSQTSVRAVTNGLESITSNYSSPSGWSAATGYAVVSGVYCTTLTYYGAARGPGSAMTVGWSTADSSCRLRDLRWGGGQAIIPSQLGGVPGGGLVIYDYPNPGDLTVIITNDTTGPLDLSGIDFATAAEVLGLGDLDILANSGLLTLRIHALDHAIAALRADVIAHQAELPSPSVNSLVGKLDSAASYKEAGLSAYLDGNLKKALSLWAKAAQQMTNFISQVTNGSEQGNVPQYLYTKWVITGDGLPMAASEVLNGLLALPEGQSLQSLAPLDADLPSWTGLDPDDLVLWPTTLLEPGEYTAFVISGLELGAGFIMQGSVVDADGNVYLNWIEQGEAAPPVIDTDPPQILAASATPDSLWSPDHTMRKITLDVTVVDDTYAVWYVAGVSSNQPVSGTGDGDTAPDWWIDPNDPQVLWLRAERSGNHPTETRWYTITLQAIDMGGNLSDLYDDLFIPVAHDQG